MKSPAVFFVAPFLIVFGGLVIYDGWYSDEVKPNQMQIEDWSDSGNSVHLYCSKKCDHAEVEKILKSRPGSSLVFSACTDLPENNQCVIHFQSASEEEVMGWPNTQACPYSREKGANVCI